MDPVRKTCQKMHGTPIRFEQVRVLDAGLGSYSTSTSDSAVLRSGVSTPTSTSMYRQLETHHRIGPELILEVGKQPSHKKAAQIRKT